MKTLQSSNHAPRPGWRGRCRALPPISPRAGGESPGNDRGDPQRLIVFYTHYGCLTDRWFPKLSHGPLTTADYMAMDTLQPMAPYAKKLLMVRGIRSMNEWSNEGSYGQKNDPHTQVNGSFFTCQPVTPNADSGFDTSDPSGVSPKSGGQATGRSLDHFVRRADEPEGRRAAFHRDDGVSGNSTNTMHIISSSKAQEIFPGVSSPMALYNRLTGLFGSGA